MKNIIVSYSILIPEISILPISGNKSFSSIDYAFQFIDASKHQWISYSIFEINESGENVKNIQR